MGRTKKIPVSSWSDHRRKTRILLEASEVSFEFELYDAVGVLSVHSAILYADAALIKNAGLKSAPKNHDDVLGLLAANLPKSTSSRKQLSKLLSIKNEVEYTGIAVDKKRAQDLIKIAKRFAGWCEDYLPG